MNTSKVYSSAVGRGPSQEEIEAEKKFQEAKTSTESAGRVQSKINWLNSTITQELLTKLATRRKELIETSINLASSYHVHQNHLDIIKNLVLAQQLQELIDTTKL